MAIETKTNYGNISITSDAIASLAGGIITECYGVVGMASKQVLKDGWAELLKKENYARGVVVTQDETGLVLNLYVDLYIIVSFGIKITETVKEAQKKVKYMLEKTLSQDIHSVNVFVQGVRVMN